MKEDSVRDPGFNSPLFRGCDKHHHDTCCWVTHTTSHVAAMINSRRPDSARGKKEDVSSRTVGCPSGLG